MGSSDARLIENQHASRAANRRLEDVAGRTVHDGYVIPFLCECADAACIGRIEVTADEYFLAHLDTDRYILLPGHLRVEGEETVVDHGHYEIVRMAAG